jgi:hypothetical protein
LVQLLFTSSVEDDRCAFLEKAACRACSNARAAPGHNDNFVFESIHDFPDTLWVDAAPKRDEAGAIVNAVI